MNVLARTIRADPWRKTRFHDMKGNPINAGSWPDIPRVAAEAAMRHLWRRYPVRPWLCYNAVRYLERQVRPSWHVLEYGSGASTLWFAQRVAAVHSIEANQNWLAFVRQRLPPGSEQTVTLEYRSGALERVEEFARLTTHPDASLDCVLIDAHARDVCVPEAVRVIRPGGLIVLDNTDMGTQWESYARAEQLLLEAARARGARWTFFTGLPPATFTANQTLIVEWTNHAA